jgi:hypothetical protein
LKGQYIMNATTITAKEQLATLRAQMTELLTAQRQAAAKAKTERVQAKETKLATRAEKAVRVAAMRKQAQERREAAVLRKIAREAKAAQREESLLAKVDRMRARVEAKAAKLAAKELVGRGLAKAKAAIKKPSNVTIVKMGVKQK